MTKLKYLACQFSVKFVLFGGQSSMTTSFLLQVKAALQKIAPEYSLFSKHFYYINTTEIPTVLWRENFISSHVKRSPSLCLHNKSHLFHGCLHNKQNITCPLLDMNFIFSCSTRSLSPLVRYRVEHSKIKFISTRGHVISSIYQ